VVDKLQNSEGGELPTDVYGDDIEHGSYTVLTIRPVHKPQKPNKVDDDPTLFDNTGDHSSYIPSPNPSPSIPQQPTPKHKPEATTIEESKDNPIEFEFGIDRPGIVKYINSLALRSYQVRNFQMSDYLKSLFEFTNFLLLSGLDVTARGQVIESIVERIYTYIQQLKHTGKYTVAKEQVMNFEMLAKVYDAFGEQIKSEVSGNLFSESAVDLDRQVRIADKQLRDEEISKEYARKHGDVNNHIIEKVDVILFVCDEGQMKELVLWAEKEFNRLNDMYRQKTTKLSEALKTQYRNIVRNSAEISNIPFNLGENIFFPNDEDGDEYTDHLFVDEMKGSVRIKLNSWEKRVIAEEEKRDDFRCWYRNPSRGKDALTLFHNYKGTPKPFYPDFLIIRRDNAGDYILDILEPHDPTRQDNLGKAKGFAEYARQNPGVGRIQLIRMQKDSVGQERAFRLDMSKSSVRDKVSRCVSNDELNHIFEDEGFFQ
jgi:type III restriction enzyme